MSGLKPAYLIHGDDEARIDAWRTRLRARVHTEGPDASLEVLRDERLSAEGTIEAIGALTLGVGRRYVLADGIERWKDADVKQIAAALASIPPDTVMVLITAGKPAAALVKAVEKAGGEVHDCVAPKPAGYPRWVSEQATKLGASLDREAAQVLIERIGTNQQRLLRELEKLAIFAGDEKKIDAETVDALTVSALEAKSYELADAVIDGDAERALRLAEDLRDHNEDMMHILFSLLRKLRDCHRTAALVAAGRPASEVQSELRVPPFVAKRLIAQARRADPERLERALDLLADLDWQIRGGGDLDADSALTLTLTAATAGSRAAA